MNLKLLTELLTQKNMEVLCFLITLCGPYILTCVIPLVQVILLDLQNYRPNSDFD